MISDKIKTLRTAKGLTQTELARRLGITRSGVNAWEQGISVPSTAYLVELAYLFGVSTDYLLGVQRGASLDISGLDDDCVRILEDLVQCMRKVARRRK